MKTDKELLELAARAAGLTVTGWYGEYGDIEAGGAFWLTVEPQGDDHGWNPLTDDGDALRLAASLYLRIDFDKPTIHVTDSEFVSIKMESFFSSDQMPTARRAIVCAAANIGEKMP